MPRVTVYRCISEREGEKKKSAAIKTTRNKLNKLMSSLSTNIQNQEKDRKTSVITCLVKSRNNTVYHKYKVNVVNLSTYALNVKRPFLD